MIKKIILLVLIGALAISVLPAYADIFSDISDSGYKEEIEQLKKLKIINGYTDGRFGVNDYITRAEFAQIIVNMLKSDVSGIDVASQFSDVDREHWSYNPVGYVKALGYMQGYPDGTFKPGNNITGEEVLITLINVLGYKHKAIIETPVLTAKTLNLTKGVTVPLGSFVTRETIAKIIHNALTVDVCVQVGAGAEKTYETKKGDNILKLYHDIIYDEGLVVANDIISINGTLAPDDAIIVNNDILLCDDYEARKLVGYNIEYMYKSDDETGKKTLFYYAFKDNKTLTVDLDDYTGYNNDVFYYSADNKKDGEIKISPLADVFKNGEFFSLKQNSFDEIKEGEVTFISTKNNSVYDVLHITEYETMVVDTIDKEAQIIRDKLDKSKIIDMEDSEKIFILYNSLKKEISISDINENDVLTLVKGNVYTEIYQCSQTVSGFTSYSDASVFAGDAEYKINKNIASYFNFSNFDYSQIGFLDMRGEVSFFLNKNFNGSIVYLIKLMDKPHPTGDRVSAKYFTYDGELKASFFSERLKVNGKAYKNITFDELFRLINKDGKADQMVLINTDTEGEIISLETATPYADLRSNNENKFCEVMPLTSMMCLTDSKSFDNKIIYVRETNPIMVIPADIENASDKDFNIIYSRDLTNAVNYNIAAYNLGTDYGVCDAIMMKSSGVAPSISNSYTPLTVVTKRTVTVNEDGESVKRVYVITGSEETYFEYPTDEPLFDGSFSADSLVAGDIIRYVADTNKKLSVFNIYYHYKNGGEYERVTSIKPADKLTGGTEIILATVERYDGSYVSIMHKPKNPYDYFMFSIPREFYKVTVNGAGNAKVEKGTANDIQVGNKIILQLTYNQTMSITVIKD